MANVMNAWSMCSFQVDALFIQYTRLLPYPSFSYERTEASPTLGPVWSQTIAQKIDFGDHNPLKKLSFLTRTKVMDQAHVDWYHRRLGQNVGSSRKSWTCIAQGLWHVENLGLKPVAVSPQSLKIWTLWAPNLSLYQWKKKSIFFYQETNKYQNTK